MVAIDAKNVGTPEAPKWEVFTHGGRNNRTGLTPSNGRKMQQLGAGEILLTSMDRDGTKVGFDLGLTRGVSDAVSIPVIASGGLATCNTWQTGSARPCRRSIGGEHFPLWRIHRSASKAADA